RERRNEPWLPRRDGVQRPPFGAADHGSRDGRRHLDPAGRTGWHDPHRAGAGEDRVCDCRGWRGLRARTVAQPRGVGVPGTALTKEAAKAPEARSAPSLGGSNVRPYGFFFSSTEAPVWPPSGVAKV